jgi:hypothetical protein
MSIPIGSTRCSQSKLVMIMVIRSPVRRYRRLFASYYSQVSLLVQHRHADGYAIFAWRRHPHLGWCRDSVLAASGFDRASCHSRNDLPLEEYEHDEERNSDDDHIREEQVPLRAELAHEAVQRQLHGDVLRAGEEVEG